MLVLYVQLILIKNLIDNLKVHIVILKLAYTYQYFCIPGIWRDEMWPDKWTAVTEDGKRSAQFEHTLLVTETGCDILTKRPDKDGQPHFMDKL